MKTFIRRRTTVLIGLGALTLLAFGSPMLRAQPGSGNLPVYTSPIDITGLKLQLRAVAPDRDSGRPVDVALPVGLIGPKMNQLFSTPLSTQIDQYWNTNLDPKTGMTARQAACDGKDGIKQQVAKQVAKRGPSYSAYDISCNLATKGQLVVKQVGYTMYLAYLLTNNTVSFASTSPQTCRSGSGTPVCPNDPRFTVRFATEIVTVVRTPALCALVAEGGTVYVVAASFEATNGAAEVAKFLGGKDFIEGEVAITNTVRNQPLPLDDAFKELRTSDACTGRTPGVSRILGAFRELETVIDLRQGIILRATHAGIVAPTLDGSNPGSPSNVQIPSVPSFTRPMISTAQPLVKAGNTVQASGQYFPPNTNLATALTVTLRHGGYGENSTVLGGVCFGGATELGSGPLGGAFDVRRLAGNAQGACAASYETANLMPNTAYQFRARDCDTVTCSPWSPTLRVTTARVDPAKGRVALTLDGGTPVGAATVNAQGTFTTSITIPGGTSPGAHALRAVAGDARAEVAIQVASASTTGASRASMTMIALLRGETGCPNHPIRSTQTDDTFMLFGAGFAAGTVTVRLDTATGVPLGAATVRADGSICQRMQSAPGNKTGAHKLVAVQNGIVVAQADVTFVLPSGVR